MIDNANVGVKLPVSGTSVGSAVGVGVPAFIVAFGVVVGTVEGDGLSEADPEASKAGASPA